MDEFNPILYSLKKVALNSTVNFKHAAGLIHKDILWQTGLNKFMKKITIKQNKGTQTYYRTVHAEIDVMLKFHHKRQLKGMDIIVIRVNKNNLLKNSKPCYDCICKLRQMGIRKVYYSDKNGRIVYEYASNIFNSHVSHGNRIKLQ